MMPLTYQLLKAAYNNVQLVNDLLKMRHKVAFLLHLMIFYLCEEITEDVKVFHDLLEKGLFLKRRKNYKKKIRIKKRQSFPLSTLRLIHSIENRTYFELKFL